MDSNLESISNFIIFISNKKVMEYLSLYDYLGKPAGEQLGKEVYEAARKQGVKAQSREISNPKFTGKVLLYPKDFLDFYFRKPTEDVLPKGHDWTGNIDDDDLPF
jgi:hypothetical protein